MKIDYAVLELLLLRENSSLLIKGTMLLSKPLLNSFKLVNLGRISYQDGLTQQQHYIEKVKASKTSSKSENYVLALEHHPVYTVGIRSKLYSATEEQRLKALGADFHRTSRGGLITFHGPGQLVLYPILDLRRIGPKPLGVRVYVESLEQTLIDCASNEFNVKNVGRTKHTGVWVGTDRKLAALGIAVSHGVSNHGLALNCNTDLEWFKHVVGCGVEGAEATSLSRETGRDVQVHEALPALVRSLARNLQCDVDDSHFVTVSKL